MIFSKENQIIITCNCGCQKGYTFINEFGCIWVTVTESNFYTKQNNFIQKIEEKTKNIIKLLNGRRIFLSEIIINEQELKELLELLKDIAPKINDEELDDEDRKNKNKSKIVLRDITDVYDSQREFTIRLITPITLKDILLNKEFRSYDTYLTKKETEKLIKRIEYLLENPKKFN